MSVVVQPRPGGRAQLRVRHRLLPKGAFFFTFSGEDSEQRARDYGVQMQAMLDAGVLPRELAESAKVGADPLISKLIEDYTRTQPVTDSDAKLLPVLSAETRGLTVSGVTFSWVEGYVRGLKTRKRNLAPGTIRKRVGALARVLDWHLLRESERSPGSKASNVLRLLPVGYSQYSRRDVQEASALRLTPKMDVTRDRRLTAEEEGRVRSALAGEIAEHRQRPLPADPDFALLFDVILHTGMRLREAYRLRVGQVDLAKGVINVEGTKGARGLLKPRVVPMTPALASRLEPFVDGRKPHELLMGLWDGTAEDLIRATVRLSVRFKTLFSYAVVPGLTEHDLRHTATCRWFEIRRPDGAWVFSEMEICRIMGWTNPKMALRYLSLRGEDLASRLR